RHVGTLEKALCKPKHFQHAGDLSKPQSVSHPQKKNQQTRRILPSLPDCLAVALLYAVCPRGPRTKYRFEMIVARVWNTVIPAHRGGQRLQRDTTIGEDTAIAPMLASTLKVEEPRYHG
ncbi:hypothetical protein JMJ77_0012901, partial [Colletotrichum scovillei]